MYAFAPDPSASKPERYAALLEAARALVDGERDAVANMANIAALIWQFVPGLNWAGFYRAIGIRIPFGQGVCGAAARSGVSQLVPDVHAFPGHIACDADSRSELVVPVKRDGAVTAVIDLDSPEPARFDSDDAAGIEALAEAIAAAI